MKGRVIGLAALALIGIATFGSRPVQAMHDDTTATGAFTLKAKFRSSTSNPVLEGKRVEASFTRSAGSSLWNPGRVTIFNSDGTKFFEQFGAQPSITFSHYTRSDGRVSHQSFGTVSIQFTVDSVNYSFLLHVSKRVVGSKASTMGGAGLWSSVSGGSWSGSFFNDSYSKDIATLVLDP